jgi:predicted PurR-regulated permease PerM
MSESRPSNRSQLIQRVNQNLLCIVLVAGILFFGRIFLVPVTFAILLSFLMLPICKYLDRRGLHRAISVLLCVLILLITICTIAGIVGLQFLSFVEDLPQIKERSGQNARPRGDSSSTSSGGSGSLAMMYEPMGMIRRRRDGTTPSV